MKKVQTTFLFRHDWSMDPAEIGHMLAAKLVPEHCAEFRLAEPDEMGALLFDGGAFRLRLRAENAPMPIERCDHALDSLVSNARRESLADTLFSHRARLEIGMQPTPGEGVYLSPAARLRILSAAHAANACLAELLRPAAVHWTHSDQLLTAGQFAHIAIEPTPMALFAAGFVEGETIRIATPDDLCNRSILVWRGKRPVEEAYATGLAFLRHLVTSVKPLPDGDTYGPVRGCSVVVRHLDVAADRGRRAYHLTMKPLQDGTHPRDAGNQASALAAIHDRMRTAASSRPISRSLFSTAM